MLKTKLKTKTKYIQNFPLEGTCYEFYKSLRAHLEPLTVFLASLVPSIARTKNVCEQQLMHKQVWQHGIYPIQYC
jgi:hypothetical protein